MEKKGGRPIEFTKDVVNKLEQAFSLDCTVSEACLYADISRQTYYTYVDEKAKEGSKKKQLFDRFEELRQRPFLKARQTIVKNLDQPEHAKWYMERKKKMEFAPRTEHTGKEGRDLIPDKQSEEKASEAINTYLNK